MRVIRRHGDRRNLSLDIDSGKLKNARKRIYPPEDISSQEFLLPIAIFSKEILLDFDSTGSLATRGISDVAAYAWLLGGLDEGLRKRVEAASVVKEIIWNICRSNDWDSEDFGGRFDEWKAHVHESFGACTSLWRSLEKDEFFLKNMYFLQLNYLPLLVLRKEDYEDGCRHVVKFAVEYGDPPENFMLANKPNNAWWGIKAIPFTMTFIDNLEGHCEHIHLLLPSGTHFTTVPRMWVPNDLPKAEQTRIIRANRWMLCP